MVNIVTTPEWKSVRILEQEELALGGENGNMNEQAIALVARSDFLKQRAAYQYNTLTEANADIANIAVNQNVNVVDSGSYYKTTARATNLTKSPYDPLTQAKIYTDSSQVSTQNKIAVLSNKESDIRRLNITNNLKDATLSKSKSLKKFFQTVKGGVSFTSSTSFTLSDFKISALSVNIDSKIEVLKDGKAVYIKKLFGGDSINDDSYKSYWKKLSLSTSDYLNTTDVSADQYFIIAFSNADIVANVDINNSDIRNILVDATGVITATTTANFATTVKTGVLTISGHPSRGVQVGIPYSVLTSNNFSATALDAEIYAKSIIGSLDTYARYKTQQTLTNDLLDVVFEQGNYVINYPDTLGKINAYAIDETNQIQVIDSTYDLLSCTVQENSGYNRTNTLVELKVSFAVGQVFSDQQLVVVDSANNQYECQFAPDFHVNLSKDQLKLWHDGSFKSGTIYVLDSLLANEKKTYDLRIYQSKVKAQSKNVSMISQTANGVWYKLFDYAARFEMTNSTVGNALICIAKNSALQDQFPIVHRVVAGLRDTVEGTTYSTYFMSNNQSMTVSRHGDLFVDIEFLQYANAIKLLPIEKSLKSHIIYRFFKNGTVKIMTIVTPQTTFDGRAINAVRSYFQNGAALTAAPTWTNNWDHMTVTLGTTKYDTVLTCYHGDTHRDGIQAGAGRSTNKTGVVAGTGFDLRCGWYDATVNSESSLLHNFHDADVWYTEAYVLINSPDTDSKTIVDKLCNPLIGFLGKKQVWAFKKKEFIQKVENNILAFLDYWYSPDAEVVTFINQTTVIGNPTSALSSNFSLHTCLLVKFLATGEGNFDEIYNGFMQLIYSKTNGSPSQWGNKFTDGSLFISNEGRYTFPALHWLYLYAEKIGDTTKMNALKVPVLSLATVVAEFAITNNGMLQNGTGSGKGASNLVMAAMRLLGLAVYMGVDSTGRILQGYNALEASLTSSDSFMRVKNQINDESTGGFAHTRYHVYQAMGLSAYVPISVLLKRPIPFKPAQFQLWSLNGNGEQKDVEFCVSTSRRGIRAAPIMGLLSLVTDRTDSNMNAAIKSLEAVEENGWDAKGLPCFTFDFFYKMSTRYTQNIANNLPDSYHSLADIWLMNYFKQI